MKNPNSKTSLFLAFLFLAICFSETGLQAQKEVAPEPSHYVFPKFMVGSVKMKNGAVESAVMDYNKLSEEMIFEQNGKMLALDQLETIDTVTIDSRKFIPFGKFFLENNVNAPISLWTEHKCNVLIAGHPAGYGGTSETSATTSVSSVNSMGGRYQLKLPGEYHITNATLYWIKKGNSFYKANSRNQILKIFPEKSKEIKQFIKQNNLDLKNVKDLIVLVNKCNEIYR